MIRVALLVTTSEFNRWLARLRDRDAKARILIRLERLRDGNAGDVKPVGGGVSEMRIHAGPGYRIYYSDRGGVIVVVLAGGTKSSQAADIVRAKQVLEEFEEQT